MKPCVYCCSSTLKRPFELPVYKYIVRHPSTEDQKKKNLTSVEVLVYKCIPVNGIILTDLYIWPVETAILFSNGQNERGVATPNDQQLQWWFSEGQ